MDDSNLWLEYFVLRKQWQVKETASKGTNKCCSNCAVSDKRLPEGCPLGKWRVYDGSKWVTQPAVTVSTVSKEEVKAYRVELQREAARVVTGTSSVRIVGTTGINAALVNGVYEPTDEMSKGNVTVYRKADGSGGLLEYLASTKQWQVKPTAVKGTDLCRALCVSPDKRLPECPGGQWRVWDGSKHVPQPAVAVSTVSKEEVDAYRAELQQEAARVVSGTCSVRIDGAMGAYTYLGKIEGIVGGCFIHAATINGVYEPTDELSKGNVTVYRKVGDSNQCLEYLASTKQWQVKATANKGKDGCWSYCNIDDKCLPEKCPVGQWSIWTGTKFVPQPAVTVTLINKEEVETAHKVESSEK